MPAEVHLAEAADRRHAVGLGDLEADVARPRLVGRRDLRARRSRRSSFASQFVFDSGPKIFSSIAGLMLVEVPTSGAIVITRSAAGAQRFVVGQSPCQPWRACRPSRARRRRRCARASRRAGPTSTACARVGASFRLISSVLGHAHLGNLGGNTLARLASPWALEALRCRRGSPRCVREPALFDSSHRSARTGRSSDRPCSASIDLTSSSSGIASGCPSAARAVQARGPSSCAR
jgi:hypothetical protein